MPPALEAWLADTSALQVLIIIGIALFVIGGVVKIWPFLSRAVTTINALASLPVFMAETTEKIDVIKHEVEYNSGTSIKDAVRRVEAGVAGLHDKIDTESIERHAEDKRLADEIEHTQPRPTGPYGVPQ